MVKDIIIRLHTNNNDPYAPYLLPFHVFAWLTMDEMYSIPNQYKFDNLTLNFSSQ